MPQAAQTGSWLAEQWAGKLAQAIGSMLGDAPPVLASASEQTAPSDADILWWEQPFNVLATPACWIGAPRDVWRQIGNDILVSAGIDDADEENIKSTFLEIVNQSLSALAQVLSMRLRREVTCKTGSEASPASAPAYSVRVTLGGAELTIYTVYTEPFLTLCAEPLPPVVSEKKVMEKAPDDRSYPKGLDLLLDVELPVSVSFGRAQLPIKDVIKLTTGSIVELNRAVSEPVEVIVNNVVIARGEVVVIEGNFGVRIKEVISRQERLRTLR